ncbi:hypothetical protein [Methylotenera sp.]|uniref:hypothetical protein n=1 Tax=Methylotenera sp. TaxID=2051956 RepID=UPI00248A5931|nr:hypothetical protein [Methylotenera sp.]MDI1361745.1 hypothetical protein [Methylotenera sp.]
MASSEDNNFLTETFTSAKELITERFSSPFIFSFFVSWIIFNYKVAIITFTDVSDSFSIENKLSLINSTLVKSSLSVPYVDVVILLNAFALPFMAACFYTFIYPFADYYITRFTLDRKVKIRNARVLSEGKIVYSQKDVQKIYLQYSVAEKDLTSRIERAEVTENQLRTQLESLEKLIASQKLAEDERIKSESEKSQNESNKPLAKSETIEMEKLAKDIQTFKEVSIDDSPKIRRITITKKQISELINNLSNEELKGISLIGEVTAVKSSVTVKDFSMISSRNTLDSLVESGLARITTDLSTLEKIVNLTGLGNQIYKQFKNTALKQRDSSSI